MVVNEERKNPVFSERDVNIYTWGTNGAPQCLSCVKFNSITNPMPIKVCMGLEYLSHITD